MSIIMEDTKTKSFIEKSIEKHGNRYEYLTTKVSNMNSKVEIYCKKHNKFFLQSPKVHLRGCGCPECGKIVSSTQRKMTTEEFIKKAKEIHGDIYDYSVSIYVTSQTLINIKCKKHGTFQQKPNGHLSKRAGCNLCAIERNSNKQRSTTEEFTGKARELWGDRFDYSKVEYINASTHINILCKEHGLMFRQTPNGHLSGNNGCTKCLGWCKNTEDFIEKSREIHGDAYIYDETNWIRCDIKVKICCKDHGIFEQTPNNHLFGNGCEKCARRMYIFSTEEFIEKAREVHGNIYDYSLSSYTKMTDILRIGCKEHGEFSQSPSNHITHSQGCPECGNIKKMISRRKSLEEFIERVKEFHGDKYDYSRITKDTYVDTSTAIEIGCSRCNTFFWQKPKDHYRSGCSNCRNKTEFIVYNFLIEKGICVIREKSFTDCRNIKPLPFDMFLEKHKILLEIDGNHHFFYVKRYHKKHSLEERQETDFKKMDYALDNGYTVIRICQEDVYENKYDWQKDLIDHIKIYDIPEVIYLSKNDKYDDYKQKYENNHFL